MSKSFCANPVFSEIEVRVGCVANPINCNAGFVCISLHRVKSNHRNVGQRTWQTSCYILDFILQLIAFFKLNQIYRTCALHMIQDIFTSWCHVRFR